MVWTQFIMYITEQEEGLYNLYFHSCPNYNRELFALNFVVSAFIFKFLPHTDTDTDQ